jgi:hypothetical protein
VDNVPYRAWRQDPFAADILHSGRAAVIRFQGKPARLTSRRPTQAPVSVEPARDGVVGVSQHLVDAARRLTHLTDPRSAAGRADCPVGRARVVIGTARGGGAVLALRAVAPLPVGELAASRAPGLPPVRGSAILVA